MIKLNDGEIPPSHIMQISGHKNIQSVINYSSINLQQQKKMSNILSGINPQENKKEIIKTQSAQATTTSACAKTEMPLSLKLFEGATIHWGEFHIAVNTLTQSPNLVTTENSNKKEEKIDY